MPRSLVRSPKVSMREYMRFIPLMLYYSPPTGIAWEHGYTGNVAEQLSVIRKITQELLQ